MNTDKIKNCYEGAFNASMEYKPGRREMDGLIAVAQGHGYEKAYHLIAQLWGDDTEIVNRRAEQLASFEFVDKGLHLDGLTRDAMRNFVESRKIMTK